MRDWFKNRKDAEFKFGDIGVWNVSEVSDMGDLFRWKKKFNADISRWDVSKVKVIKGMFEDANSFDLDITKKWSSRTREFADDTLKQAVKMWQEDEITTKAFYGHISGWNVSKVRDMSRLFEDVKDFNEDISAWEVSRTEKMSGMFRGATSFDKKFV